MEHLLKLSTLKVQDNILAVNLDNADLATINLVGGSNGIGKTKLLHKIKHVVDTEAGWLPVFLITDCDFDLTAISNYATKIDLSFEIALVDIMKNNKDFIKQIEPDIESLRHLDNRILVKLKSSDTHSYLDEMGRGFQRIIEILLNCYYLYDGILLIDSVELGVSANHHKALMSCIIEYAREQRNQVFMTTHSQDMIQSLSELTCKKFKFADHAINSLFIRLGRSVKNSNKGEVIATAFDEKTLESMLGMGIKMT